MAKRKVLTLANIRQQIIDALETRMGAITTIEKVAVWKASDLAPTDLPAILIRDTVDNMPVDGVGAGRLDHDLAVEITAMFSGNTSATDAREMIASIVAAIGTDPTFSGLAFDTILISADLDLEDSAQLIAAAQISLTIRYRSGMWSI